MKKKKQYKVMQFNFDQITDQDGKIIVNSKPKSINNSGNLFYDLIFRIQDREYDNSNIENNILDEILIFNAAGLNPKDESAISKYQRIINQGIWYKDSLYVREGAIKSASMTRTQRTLFIRADLKDKVDAYVSLGKKPEQTIISKYETAKGLLLSDAVLLDDCMPRIVIIPDYEKEITSNVRIVEEYKAEKDKLSAEEQEYQAERESEKQRWVEINAEVERCREIFTDDYLKKLPRKSYINRDTYKSRSSWKADNNRRVRPEEISNPECYGKYNDLVYPCYHIDQTEEIKSFSVKPYSVGLEIKEHKDYPCKVNVFDGMGCADTSWMKRISKELDLGYTTQGIQIRLPYIKGYVVSFPIKKWARDHNVSKIKDIWGKEWDLYADDIDMIICESCFKAKLDKSKEGMQQWLFSSMEDYYECLSKYGYDKVGIAAYTKHINKNDLYTRLTYQHIYAFDLTRKDINKIALKTVHLGKKILGSTNVAYVKAYLNMLASDEEETEEEEYVNAIHKAIDLNHRMLFDPHIRLFLANKARDIWRELLLGRAYVRGHYIYAAGDTIAFMEHAFGLEVKGFLDKHQLYCTGKQGEHIVIRNPVTHYSEVLRSEFIEADNPYIKHLDNICQFPSTYDLCMARMNLDFDGDKVLITDNPVLLQKMIPTDVIYNPGDKDTAKSMEYTMENILKYEMLNLENLTGQINQY